MTTVTRVAIAEAVALARLPEQHFSHVRDLWKHLPEVPVE